MRTFLRKRNQRRDAELCRNALAQVQQIVDGELPSCKSTKLLLKHLEACGYCAEAAAAVKALKEAVCRCSEVKPDVVERLKRYAEGLCDAE